VFAFLTNDNMELFLTRETPQGDYFVLPDEESLPQWIKLLHAKGAQRGLNLDRIKELHGSAVKPEGFHLIGHGEAAQHERYIVTYHVAPMKATNPEDTTVDFRDRGFGVDVVAGQSLAEYLSEGPGKDGFNCLGARLAYRSEGKPVSIKGNANVAVEKEGNTTRFLARIDGVLDNRNLCQLDVYSELVIKGGLNFNTGDVRTAHAICIEGDVGAGFTARSGTNILVKGSVEKGAILDAGGDIRVEGGIATGVVMRAGKHIFIKFAQGLQLEAGGDVQVEQYLFDAQLRAKGKLISMGKGRPDRGAIVGGVFNAVGGMELESVGSATAYTLLAVGVDLELEKQIEDLQSETEKIKGEIQRQIRLLPVNILAPQWKERMQQLPVDKKQMCRQRLIKISELRKEAEQGQDGLKMMLERKSQLQGGHYISVGTMAPDCELRIGDAKMRVVKAYSNVTWKVAEGKIVAFDRVAT
jgi:uncharacterized protein (DUF342 family)